MFVAGVPALVNRLSFSGELGYEMYVAPHYQLKLYEAIEEAGQQFNIKPFGGRALMSMRLEKNWGAWTLDFRPDFTPRETGLSAFIKWDKDFIGKGAADKDDSNHRLFSLHTKCKATWILYYKYDLDNHNFWLNNCWLVSLCDYLIN